MHLKIGGFLIVGLWLFLTWLVSNSIFSLITPKEIPLSTSSSCQAHSYQDTGCLKVLVQPEVTKEVQSSLVASLTGTQKAASIFSFSLGLLEFQQVIENRNSRIEVHVSYPAYVKSVLPSAKISCNFRGKTFYLDNNSRYSTGEYIRLYTLAGQDLDTSKKNIDSLAKYIVSGYQGCDWVPTNITFTPKPGEIIVGPNETVSFVKIVSPFLIFVPTWLTTLIVYFGAFVLFGGIIALFKQFIEILLKGFGYFVK